MPHPPPSPDTVWNDAARHWSFPPGVTYLNHGSFGPSPEPVLAAFESWTRRIECEPMQFFLRDLEAAWTDALHALARFVDADPDGLIFVDNATFAMNVVAASVPLRRGDGVLLSDHEYGAVRRLWETRCREAGAQLQIARLPCPIRSTDEVLEAFQRAASRRTRLLVISHVTSPTALVLPVQAVGDWARQRDILVCIDGPHALAMLPLSLKELPCDFYTASCHKWLSAPFGSGFLYVAQPHRRAVRPVVRSWGRSFRGRSPSWKDEFVWLGTRNPAAFLAVPAAIAFLESWGADAARSRMHQLARDARKRLTALREDIRPICPDDSTWYAAMCCVELPGPPARREPLGDPLQERLWERFRIEVPLTRFGDRRLLRVSCHLYNREADLDRLAEALSELLTAR
ncbi:MAG: aminotransferase class V-fold PLP-dependent enzyme [Planctomycetota bacterium]|nr:MAG: aminotransferase class V-fold PLP-dependent enzyme [Planctomycetota bacterium]